MFGQAASQALSEVPSEAPSEAPSEVPSEATSQAASMVPSPSSTSPKFPASGPESSEDEGLITGPLPDIITEADKRIHFQFLTSLRQAVPFREFTLRQLQRALFLVRVCLCGTVTLPRFCPTVMQLVIVCVLYRNW